MLERIYGEGPTDAAITFVGEGPGDQELRQRRPFVGPSGVLLDEMLESVGIRREECRLDNLFHYNYGHVAAHYKYNSQSGTVTTSAEFDLAQKALKEFLKTTTSNVIVAFGNPALYALTGNSGIQKWRGSVIESSLLPGRKVIPMIHPAAVLREVDSYVSKTISLYDLERIKANATYPEVKHRKREVTTTPTFSQVLRFIRGAQEKERVAFDIEVRGSEVSHLSIATSPDNTICIPFVKGFGTWWTLSEEVTIWERISALLEDESVVKVGQNVTFDSTFLFRKLGIRCRPLEDTMVQMGILFPEFPKNLGFICSMYCDGEPYFKDDGKEWMKNPFGSDERFRHYSAMDSAVTLESFEYMEEDLKSQGNWDSYKRQVALVEPLVFMGEHGIAIDVPALREASKVAGREIELEQTKLELMVGKPLNVYSFPQMKQYFYEDLNLKAYKSKKGRDTLDKNALARLAARGYREADQILTIRELRTAKSKYFDMSLDEDDRVRGSYNPVGTVQARLSCSATIFGTGTNMQNLHSRVKELLRPDPGYCFVSIDLSQAENRIVAYIAGEHTMMADFESRIDIHKRTASLISGVPIHLIDTELRKGGKRANHALNYGMGYRTYADYYRVEYREARHVVDMYHSGYPGVKEWHEQIKWRLKNEGAALTNLFGRIRQFIGPVYGKGSTSTYKKGYSFIPQSSVAENTNHWGLSEFYRNQEHYKLGKLAANIHDSILFQWPIAHIPELVSAIDAIKASMEQTLHGGVRPFYIPADIQIGLNLKDAEEISSYEWDDLSRDEKEGRCLLATAA